MLMESLVLLRWSGHHVLVISKVHFKALLCFNVGFFLQDSLNFEVEELEENNLISLTVERKRGSFGRLTVHWAANGSLADIYPTSGVVSNLS